MISSYMFFQRGELKVSKQTEMKYALEKFEILDENLDSDFALCKIYICSDGKNLHGVEIALEAIIQAQESLKNKYLVAKINKEGNDFEGHEFDERIIRSFSRKFTNGNSAI